MKMFEIWLEGYVITGQSSGASYIGKAQGKDLQEAVKNWYKDKKDELHWLNKDYTTYWGCRFFDNEKDARKAFG